MSSLLIRGGHFLQVRNSVSGPLRGSAMQRLPAIEHGYLLAENGIISGIGPVQEAPDRADIEIDGTGRLILPCWCDSHTHIVYAASREEEFVMRIQGRSYEEIAASGGGILNSAAKLQSMDEDLLYRNALSRLNEIIGFGTGAVEIKSGYGLTTESELKMLRVIRRLKGVSPIPVKATFLGAHAIPREYQSDRQAYIRLIIDEMLPVVADEGLAEYIDVFCDRGFYTIEESEQILEAGHRYGLKPKIHVSEIANIGGVQMGIRSNAVSVDHLECAGAEEVRALSESGTIATLLPSCAFFLKLGYGPARELIDSGAAVALASDYNPGSTPSGKIPFVISLGCIQMNMLPEEAVNAVTVNGACAMELEDHAGHIRMGLPANLIITRPVSSLSYIPYAFGGDHIQEVLINGRPFEALV